MIFKNKFNIFYKIPGKEFNNLFLRNIEIVGPKTSDPKGEVLFLTIIPSLEKNLIQEPSFLRHCFLVLTIIELCLDFFIDQALDLVTLTLTLQKSPHFPIFLKEPPYI